MIITHSSFQKHSPKLLCHNNFIQYGEFNLENVKQKNFSVKNYQKIEVAQFEQFLRTAVKFYVEHRLPINNVVLHTVFSRTENGKLCSDSFIISRQTFETNNSST